MHQLLKLPTPPFHFLLSTDDLAFYFAEKIEAIKTEFHIHPPPNLSTRLHLCVQPPPHLLTADEWNRSCRPAHALGLAAPTQDFVPAATLLPLAPPTFSIFKDQSK